MCHISRSNSALKCALQDLSLLLARLFIMQPMQCNPRDTVARPLRNKSPAQDIHFKLCPVP